MNITKCSDCGKPMQYCECKFGDKFLDEISRICNWYITKNIAPLTEYEYFQQIGSE